MSTPASTDVETAITHGYLIVKPYATLYRKYMGRYKLTSDYYAIPRVDRTPEQSPIQYRGVDRDALSDYEKSDTLAEVRMAELVVEGRCEEGFLFADADLNEVLALLPSDAEYEVVWTRIAGVTVDPPVGFEAIGFEPTFFIGDHFSASCDCLLIPRWHGTDKEGTLFAEHFRRLNAYGLFGTAVEAKVFLDFYLSFDWTETGEYSIAEVFLPPGVRR